VRRISLGVLVAWFVLALSLVPASFAQNTSGSVRGTVSDEQGAAIAGANVTITNSDTGDSRSDKTGKDGAYAFPSLPVGRYSLNVTGDGFKAFQVKDIILHVDDSLTVDAQLKVGAKTETIEVVAESNQVELANAELSGTIAGAQITELPLNGRSFAQLLTLVPGVAQDNGFSYNQKGLKGGADLSISGGASNANTFLVDGANNVDIGSGRTLLVYPSIDSIEEFKVERNSYGAEFGGNSGGQVTLVTKSGTNEIHGSAYWFGRNDYVNANDSTLKFNNPGAKTPLLRRNDFGYTVGGPVKKDKIFFFWSQEWNRQITGIVRSGNVPTPLERTGDFSDQANDPTGNSANTVGCLPKAGLSDPGNGAGGAFTASANNNVGQTGANFIDKIPASRVSTAGLGVLNTYFLPTLAPGTPGYGCGTNFSKSFSQPNNFREESIRGDINLTRSVKLMLKYTQDINTFGPPASGSTGWGADSGTSPISDTWSQPSRIAVARLTNVIGSTAVNDFQFSFSDNRINILPTNQAAFTALSGLFSQFMPAANKGFTPANGPATWLNGPGGLPTVWSFAPWHNSENLYTFQDDYSKVIGRHTLKLGALYSRNQKNQDLFDTENGSLGGATGFGGCKGHGPTDTTEPVFCQGLTANSTGSGPADLYLAGMAFGWSEQGNFFSNLGRWENLEWYVNDDIKVSSRLTLNLGMRYSYLPNPYAANDQYTVFNQAAFNPALGNATCNGLYYSPGLLANPCPPGSGGLPGPNRALRNNYTRGFAPRLGVAWDPTGQGKWALRAGFGQFYNRDDITLTDGLGGVNPPFVGSFRSVNGNGRFLDNTNPLPACGNTAATCFGTGLGNASVGTELVARQPYTIQYNFTVQREIWKNSRLEAGYVASRTYDAQSKYDANAIAPANRLAYAQSNGNANLLFRPYDVINSGNIAVYGYHGKAAYDSLQAAFNSRLQHGLSFALAYTYSKTLSDVALRSNNGNGNLILDPFNPGASEGLATIDRPHIFAANLIYDTPTMHSWNRIERSAFENWEVGSIINVSSGTPYTPVINNFSAAGSGVNELSGIGLGDGSYRPNIVAGQPCRNSSFTAFQWINPNRYTLNGFKLGTIGTSPVGDCLGPGVARMDFSISRYIRLTERLKLQIRVDAFNLFNHPQYNNPNGGNTNGFAGIGFNAANTAASPAYLDASGAPTTSLANAVSIANSSPSANPGRVTTDSERNRQLQGSLRLTF